MSVLSIIPLFVFSQIEKSDQDMRGQVFLLEKDIQGKNSNISLKDNSTSGKDQEEFIARGYVLGLRANLLHWITLTPDLGVEYRNYGLANLRIGILVHGAWTGFNLQKLINGQIHFWKINPEIRCYLGRKQQAYLGLAYNYVTYDIRFNKGYTGDAYVFSITTGYQVRLDKRSNFYLDFNIGLGYANLYTQPYSVTASGKVNSFGNPYITHYIGCTQLGISLIWAFVKEPL